MSVQALHCKLVHKAADAEAGTPAREWLMTACDALARLCRTHELNRMRELRGGDALVVLRRALESLNAELPATPAFCTAAAALRTLRAVQRRSENAKQSVAADGGIDLLLLVADRAVSALTAPVGDKESQRAACAAARGAHGALRQLLVADDAAVAVSETFNRARILTGQPSVMASGLRSLNGDKTLPEVARAAIVAGDKGGFPDAGGLIAEAVGAVRVCAVSDAIVQVLADIGYPALVDIGVARAATALLRNLAARDQCKTEVATFAPAVARRVREANPPDQALVELLAGFVAS